MTRDELRRHLDRQPPAGIRGEGSPWRRWFAGDEYLGVRSARRGPDAVGATQPCSCDACQTATVWRQFNERASTLAGRGERHEDAP